VRRRVGIAVAVGFLAGAASVGAEIVVLATGGFLKVDAHRVVGDRLEVDLPEGGTMSLPLTAVERVLDDEIVEEAIEPLDPADGVELWFREQQPVPQTPFGEAIHQIGRRFSMNPDLIAAVVAAESAFDPEAVSGKGAQGLMQIMPATAERFGVPAESIFQPEVNLEVGVRYLAKLRQRYEGDLSLMLAAYNAGEATVERFGGVPPYRETQEYIRRIYRIYGEARD